MAITWNGVRRRRWSSRSSRMVTIVRGVPRGKISAAGLDFFDPHDDEILLGYPFGAGSLFLERGLARKCQYAAGGDSEGRRGNSFIFRRGASSVRAKRFYLQPGENGYRVGDGVRAGRLGGERQDRKCAVARWARREHGGASRPHFAHVEKAFQHSGLGERTDVRAVVPGNCAGDQFMGCTGPDTSSTTTRKW